MTFSQKMAFSFTTPFPSTFFLTKSPIFSHAKPFTILCAKKSKRIGKLRYPSEKKRLKNRQEPLLDVSTKLQGFWRLFQLNVSVDNDPGKDFLGVSEALLEQIAKVLEFPLNVSVENDPGKDFLGVSVALLEQIAKVLEFPTRATFRCFYQVTRLLETLSALCYVENDLSKDFLGVSQALLQEIAKVLEIPSKRIGKLRYPSEKKRLKNRQEHLLDVSTKLQGFGRLFQLNVSVDIDPGNIFLGVSQALLQEIAKVLEFLVASMLPLEAFTVVRKSFDARKSLKEPKFVYVVDVDVNKLINLEPRTWDFISELQPKVGIIEHMPLEKASGNIISIVHDYKVHNSIDSVEDKGSHSKYTTTKKPKVAIVGSGPSGLFASLVLAELGADVMLIERGQAVEQRGRDIGALVVRKILQLESNFCFGEGGAGTWSDGKLVTRIGRNSDSVVAVMKTLVHFGAPENILVDGKPHLGTDRLIPLLRNFRLHLQSLGVNIMFGTRVDDLLVDNRAVVGLSISDSMSNMKNNHKLGCDAVVLAVGHSARDIYEMLLSHDMNLIPKDFAVGLRVEHPQELINSIQYSELAAEVRNGRGRVPVADYKVVKYLNGDNVDKHSLSSTTRRSCYSFCMCPGGQVVLTSTNPSELCVNGMSFSRRASRWANAALVVNVSSKDFDDLNLHGPLAGVEFQREFERRAATMGGGNFVVPVQTVTDFLENKLSGSPIPPSSYRLGAKEANLHELFPSSITEALQHSISKFDQELPGFISPNGLLHGVETRTSSPIQIPRDTETYESTLLKGLYPIGEGAGYAGGIVSAAVDGMYAGFALAKNLGLYDGTTESTFGKAQNSGSTNY